MSDFLMRENALLGAEEWAHLDKVVVEAARQFLVGRRFIELVGPMGIGTEMVPVGTGTGRKFLKLELIEEDFALPWRDIEANRKAGLPIELGPAAMAAAACARREDKMIFAGLLKAADKQVSPGDWGEPGSAFATVVAAVQKLVSSDFYGPYAVILSPALYAKTQRVVKDAGRLEAKLIKDVAEGGLFQTPVLPTDQGLVISLGMYNLDLVVGQDLITAYAGNDGLDHLYRVLESVVLRVKRPGAICALAQ
jgi:uncharacterized linocin/CFP29 family protein